MSDQQKCDKQIPFDYVGNELQVFTLAKNWKSYWSSKLSPIIQQPVLEVGAGIGTNLELLNNKNLKWTALEPDTQQAHSIREGYLQKDTFSNTSIIDGTLKDISEEEKYMTLLYIDVLEHIEDDVNEIANAANHLESGGRLIVLAPAHQKLFSPFDRSVGHFRRYNERTLRALTPHNLKVEQSYYLDSVGCLASLANSVLIKSKMPTAKQILFWDRILVPTSKLIDKFLLHKVGKTVVMVWRKEPQFLL